MSTSPRTTRPVVVIVPTPERTAALAHLAGTLAVLGDEASRATRTSRDVRFHVIACQAGHLAGDVRDLLPPGGADPTLPRANGVSEATVAARRALDDPAGQPLPRTLADLLGWLLALAEAATP